MAITYPRQLPAGIKIASSRMGLSVNQSIFASELTRKVSVQSIGAGTSDRWEGLWTTPHLSVASFATLSAWLLSLKGQEKTFYAYDPDRRMPNGVAVSASSTPLVKGALQAGRVLATDDWVISTADLLKAGDYIEVNGQYVMVMEDVTSDGLGNATISIEPALRGSPPDNAPVIFENPKMTARLTNSTPTWETDHRKSGPFSFAWQEVI